MERSDYLKERRRVSEVRYDTLHAAGYDQHWGQSDASHQSFPRRFLDLCAPGGTILDAARGTGKYWPLILESGRSVVGTDQSRQMLVQANGKFPHVRTELRPRRLCLSGECTHIRRGATVDLGEGFRPPLPLPLVRPPGLLPLGAHRRRLLVGEPGARRPGRLSRRGAGTGRSCAERAARRARGLVCRGAAHYASLHGA